MKIKIFLVGYLLQFTIDTVLSATSKYSTR